MQYLNQLQQEIVENLAQYANVLVLLAANNDDHLFYAYTNFEGANRTNLGSIEHNQIVGVNITQFVRNQLANPNMSAPQVIASHLANYIQGKTALIVRYANVPYLIYQSKT